MAFSGLVKANNLSDIADKEKAWDNLGLVISTVDYQSGDADIDNYINGVQEADGASLEPEIKNAIFAFITGCKADGIWTAIKASCILAGARTLAGALVPLVGAAPTNVGGLFVAGDYNRKTGLAGNGSSKYLNSNRNNNADPQDSNHNVVYVSTAASGTGIYISASATTTESGDNNFGRSNSDLFARSRTSTAVAVAYAGTTTGLIGINRSNSANYTFRNASANNLIAQASQASFNSNICIFAGPSGAFPSNARLAFYSIGESLDLAALDTRVTALIADILAILS